MKGIVLAGGSGTRLHPITLGVSKQLLPVYNKPMVYYPLSVLFLAGIREILLISTPQDVPHFQRLLSDGKQWGIEISYAVQTHPNGLAEAFLIGKNFIGDGDVALILGDNIFYGNHLGFLLTEAVSRKEGATLFGCEVKDPERYGVAEIDALGNILSIEEKPERPKSNIAVTGLYFYDNDVVSIAEGLIPSSRGELEITDINRVYVQRGLAKMHVMGRGFAWLDAGTYSSLMQAGQFIQVIEERQGQSIAALEEIAYRQGFITREQLQQQAKKLENSQYGQYLEKLLQHGIDDGNHSTLLAGVTPHQA